MTKIALVNRWVNAQRIEVSGGQGYLSGALRMRRPVAYRTALATVPAVPVMPISPTPSKARSLSSPMIA